MAKTKTVKKGVKKTPTKDEILSRGKEKSCCKSSCKSECSSGSCIYFLGFLGAAIYFISNSVGFWSGVLGVLKAIIWPLILVLEIFKFLGV